MNKTEVAMHVNGCDFATWNPGRTALGYQSSGAQYLHTCQPWNLYMQENFTHFACFYRTILHDSAPRGDLRLILSQIFTTSLKLRYYSDSHSTMAATCLLTPWAMVLNF